MTAFVISSNIVTTADFDNAVDLALNDSAYVLEGVTVAATGESADGILGVGGNRVAIYGTVISDKGTGIFLTVSDNDVFIAETGSVYGNSRGIQVLASSSVDVQGSVYGIGLGIAAQDGSFVNIGSTGTVSAGASGISISGTGNKIVNSGAIFATVADGNGITIFSDAGHSNRVVNFGTISAPDGIVGDEGNETAINYGTIEGDVVLGVGSDVYRGGGVVIGDIRGGPGNDLLIGGAEADFLFGDQTNDTLNGREGDDVLNGGRGVDLLRGGGGADVFDFNAVIESGPAAAARDTIVAFQQSLDLIDLATIDANTTAGGNQAFTFIGAAAFSAPGQVRAVQFGGNTIVQLSNDADTNPEMAFTLTGLFTLTAGDFLL